MNLHDRTTGKTGIYINAWCLDEGKDKPGFGELWIGPFASIGLTFNILRGFVDDDWQDDHQLIYDVALGLWYPVAEVQTNTTLGSSSIQADYTRGRYTDVSFDTTAPREAVQSASVQYPATYLDNLRDALLAELQWAASYEG